MITVKMANEYMIDFSEMDVVTPHLHLRTLATVYQKQPLMYIKHMSGRVSV
jgi:hypothetical protein